MNLKIILDAGTGGVVWAEDDVNITKAVMDDLSLVATPAKPGAPEDAPPPNTPQQNGGQD